MEIRDMREKPIKILLGDYLVSLGIISIETLKDLIGPSFFVVIPLDILENTTLTANAKLLYGEVLALSKKNKVCFATNKYLSERLGLAEGSIANLLQELESQNHIVRNVERNDKGTYRTITAWYDNHRGYGHSASRGVAELPGQRRNRKIEIDKELDNTIAAQSAASSEAQKILEIFYKTVNPAINFGNKTSRAAAEWLIAKFGFEKTVKTAEYAISVQGKDFAPTITTPYQLKEKLAALMLYYQKQNDKKSTIFHIS